MARSRYANNALTHSGLPVNIVPNSQITIYEAGTLTPLAQTIYAGPTGGTTLTNPHVTDEHGNVLFYLDAPQDVKIVATGVGVGTLTSDFEPVFPAVSTLLTRTTITNENDWTLTLQNEHALGKAFRILDPDGWNVFNVQRSAGGRNVVSINMKNGTVPENNLLLVAETRSDTSCMVSAELENTGGDVNVDSTAIRGVGRVSGVGTGAMRSLEAITHRLAPAVTHSTWGIGCTVFTDVAGLGPTYNVGLFLNGGAGLVGEVENDAAILVAGPKGWSHGYYQLDSPAQSTRMASIDKVGKIVSGNISPRTDGTFSLGSSDSDAWQAVYADAHVVTGAGGASAPPFTFYTNSITGMFLAAANVLGWSTGGTQRMAVSNGGLALSVPAILPQISSPSAPGSGLSLYNKTGSAGLFSIAAGGVEKYHKADGQYGIDVGLTGSATTTSASYVDLPRSTSGTALSVPLTTTGGDLLVSFWGAFAHNTNGAAIVVALSLDNAAEQFSLSLNLPSSGQALPLSITRARFTGVAAGSHTVKVRWLTSTGTATANATERYLTVEEQPH